MRRFSVLWLGTLVIGLGCSPAGVKEKAGEKPKEPARKDKPVGPAMEALWRDLGGEDPGKAYEAIWKMVERPEESVPFLAKRLKPVGPPDPKKIARLIGELDHPKFGVRDKATRELERLAELAEPALRKAAEGRPTLEGGRRISGLLEKRDQEVLAPGQVRAVRAMGVLELIGSIRAKRVLERLAGGFPEARITREAKVTLKGLARKGQADSAEGKE